MKLYEFRRINIDDELNKDIDTTYDKIKRYRKIIRVLLITQFILLLIILILFKIFIIDKTNSVYKHTSKPPEDSLLYANELSWDKIGYWIDYYNVSHKDIVLSQIYLETGNLNGWIVSINNLTGMRYPKKRRTTATSSIKGYSAYSSYAESIRDYKLWQEDVWKKSKSYSKDSTSEVPKIFVELLCRR